MNNKKEKILYMRFYRNREKNLFPMNNYEINELSLYNISKGIFIKDFNYKIT